MLANLKMKNRMVFGYAIPVVLSLGGLVLLVYASANKVIDAFQQVERVQNRIIVMNTMVRAAEGMVSTTRGYFTNQDRDFLDRYKDHLTSFQETSEIAEELMETPNQKEIFKQMISLGKEYEDFSGEIIEAIEKGNKAEAMTLFSAGKGRAIVDRFTELTEVFTETEIQALEGQNAQASSTLNALIWWMLLGSIVLLMIVVTVALLLASGITRIIKEATNAIASSSSQIAITIEEQERIINQQASAVNQTTTTMNELGASSKTTAEQAESSANSANQVLQLAESSADSATQVLELAEGGTNTVKRTMEGMSVLQEKVAAIAVEIMRLSEQNSQISTITNLVSDLANQTNMLALNAAVEAVRAGEQGKGFTVIASEIRKLADQSKTSAQKINNLVDNIEAAINSTVLVTDEGKKTAQESIKLSQETADGFAKVTQAISEVILINQQNSLKAIQEVVINSQQISLTTKQQAIAVEQVVEAMNSLNKGAVETVTGINQTKVGIQKLNETAQNLNSLV